MAVKALIFILCDLGGFSQPDSFLGVDDFILPLFALILIDLLCRKDDRISDVIAVAVDDIFQLPAVEIDFCIFFEEEFYLGSCLALVA